ncbi:DNA primase small subunit [Eupeodes corollae]|uniref:DNA primase small subunit n=1 Tax=Eupeodes corollae TaxID=290404 RepID=UPI0024920025|nr:DNA primase small subunit [Eupeodes corollae]
MKETIENGDAKELPKYDPSSLPDMLPVYYKRLFPHKPFYRWLSYGLSEPGIFSNREISFTLGDDIYIRYLCYDTESQMEKDICARNPMKIDIGAVMQNKPAVLRMSSKSMVPVQRELVFDIDMTDYDDVRTCCEGAAVCLKCWKFMTVACKILDLALREDFGFEHILWVFSGRRGIHCWVCDHSARHLDSKGRSAVAEYMQIVSHAVSGDNNSSVRAVIGERMHHSIKRALKIIEPMFEEVVLEDQNLFGSAKGVGKLLQMIPEENARKEVEAHLKKFEGANSKTIWTNFIRFVNSMRSQSTSTVWTRKMRNIVEEIQLAVMYPRLDINVTKGFNHLLKAPFCIHPSTGKLCVPFNANLASKFDPTAVPTIVSLMEEINVYDEKNKDEDAPQDKSRIKDFKKTGMFKPVVVFEEFLRKLEKSYKSRAIEVSDTTLEF